MTILDQVLNSWAQVIGIDIIMALFCLPIFLVIAFVFIDRFY
jgi:hypothetical protein